MSIELGRRLLPLAALAFCAQGAPSVRAESPFCASLRPFSRGAREKHPPSTPNVVNCAVGDPGSNYVPVQDPGATEELHVIAVRKGDTRPKAQAPGDKGLVKVVLYKTRKPAVLALSAQESVQWQITLTQEAELKKVILQGAREQTVKGLPSAVPVIDRTKEDACALSHAWEQGTGSEFKLMMLSLRCAAGLTEASFQGCDEGLLFEVPHYRESDLASGGEGAQIQACPFSEAEVKDLAKPPEKKKPSAQKKGNETLSGGEAIPMKGEPVVEGDSRREDAPQRPEPSSKLKKKNRPHGGQGSLSGGEPVPMRGDIPVRALAILLKGDKTLLTHDAIPDLIEALKKGDARLRSRAADALGSLRPPAEKAVGALLHALKSDSSARVRASAALALGNIGPGAADAVPALKRAAGNRDPELRLNAKRALELIGK